MNRITISISIDVPDGAHVSVSDPHHDGGEFVPSFADELIPLPDGVNAIAGDNVQSFRGAATGQPVNGLCPVHRVPWKTVPAGISKKTGKAYSAFFACPERGCDQRPA